MGTLVGVLVFLTMLADGEKDTHKGQPIYSTSTRVPTLWRVPRRDYPYPFAVLNSVRVSQFN